MHGSNFCKVGGKGVKDRLLGNYDEPIRNTEQHLDHIYYTLFWRCTAVLHLSPATATCSIIRSQNHFGEPKPPDVGFSSSNFTLQDHIPSTTVGDALSSNNS
jgi:hypothetical protein